MIWVYQGQKAVHFSFFDKNYGSGSIVWTIVNKINQPINITFNLINFSRKTKSRQKFRLSANSRNSNPAEKN